METIGLSRVFQFVCSMVRNVFEGPEAFHAPSTEISYINNRERSSHPPQQMEGHWGVQGGAKLTPRDRISET